MAKGAARETTDEHHTVGAARTDRKVLSANLVGGFGR
jgi:hypothetical protein